MAIAMCKALKRYPLLTGPACKPSMGRARITTPDPGGRQQSHMTKGFGAFLKRSHLDTGKLALYVAKHRATAAHGDA